MNILYLDCFSGISGDMTVGALVDAGVNPEYLENELEKLQLTGEYRLHFSKVIKKGISATHFEVDVVNEPHSHRHYADIVKLIQAAGYSEAVTTNALRIFEAIGKAEAKIHGIPLEKVHFHEVGALDSILDIVGAAIAVDQLHPDKIMASSVPVGNGQIRIDHGLYPVPAPATLDMLKGIPIKESHVIGEMTTPTGAGILAALIDEFGPIPSMNVSQIGYGAGTKDFPDHPNVLRVLIGGATDD